MIGAPPPGFMDLLNKKYAIMQQQANTESDKANAAIRAAAGGIGGGSDIPFDPLMTLKAGALQAQIAHDNASTAAVKTQSGIAEDENLRNQRASAQGLNTGGLYAPRDYWASRYDAHHGDESGTPQQAQNDPEYQKYLAFKKQNPAALPASNKKGLAAVPKTGKTTVHKGEAILNKPAADKMGRGLIAALNVMGQQKMGMV
jgi:hypothetical protein